MANDRNEIELFCYAQVPQPDAMRERLRDPELSRRARFVSIVCKTERPGELITGVSPSVGRPTPGPGIDTTSKIFFESRK
jgi:hypothetical protein